VSAPGQKATLQEALISARKRTFIGTTITSARTIVGCATPSAFAIARVANFGLKFFNAPSQFLTLISDDPETLKIYGFKKLIDVIEAVAAARWARLFCVPTELVHHRKP
jgi:hypothetical protein